MILASIKIKVNHHRSNELLQTLLELSADMRKDKKCITCRFYKNMEDERILLLNMEWETKRDFKHYLNTDRYTVFRGAMKMLSTSHEIRQYTPSLPWL